MKTGKNSTLYGKSPALTAQARRGDGGDRRGTARTGLEDLISGSTKGTALLLLASARGGTYGKENC